MVGWDMFCKSNKITVLPLFAALLTCGLAVLAVFGQSNQEKTNAGKEQSAQPLLAASSPAPAPPSTPVSPFIAARMSKRVDDFYRNVWGIEQPEVRETASGSLIRFDYRVVNASRAKPLNDKTATPYLIDERTGAILQVPTLPKVGLLRQTAEVENGHEYWMVFSNKGFLKPGARVDVVIGGFRANGLIVR